MFADARNWLGRANSHLPLNGDLKGTVTVRLSALLTVQVELLEAVHRKWEVRGKSEMGVWWGPK